MTAAEIFPPLTQGDMQWRRADGSVGTYTGPLLDLGHGIPRTLPDWGIRRALFDLAFGYVSGFPIRDILAFALTSLRPSPILDVELEPGWVIIACTSCDATAIDRPGDTIEHADGGAHVFHTTYADDRDDAAS